MSGLLSRQDAPHVALEGGSRVRQAEGHANVAVRWTLAPTDAWRPETSLRRGPVEPWNVDVDAQPAVLARMGSCAGWWAAVAAYGPCFLKLLDCLGDELLSTRRSSPCARLREMCSEACLHIVPERLPRDVG